MEQNFRLGGPGGVLLVREEGARALLEVTLPDDRRGLYKAYLMGTGGRLLLGTLMPENGALRLHRMRSIAELRKKGCWPVTGGALELAFTFGEERAAHGAWSREGSPARLMGDRELQGAVGALGGLLCRREKGGFALAVPYDKKAAFPLPTLFCFAQMEPLNGRLHVLFYFNAHGCPIFQNKEKTPGNTDGANQKKE